MRCLMRWRSCAHHRGHGRQPSPTFVHRSAARYRTSSRPASKCGSAASTRDCTPRRQGSTSLDRARDSGQALHQAAFTARLMATHERDEFNASGYGITSLVRRATATAREFAAPELVAGRRRLARKVRIHRPRGVAILGVGACRTAFADARAAVGPQKSWVGWFERLAASQSHWCERKLSTDRSRS